MSDRLGFAVALVTLLIGLLTGGCMGYVWQPEPEPPDPNAAPFTLTMEDGATTAALIIEPCRYRQMFVLEWEDADE